MSSTNCSSCGATIQDWVAKETGGLCRPCVAGAVQCAECGKPMVRQPVLKDEEHICIPCRKKTPSTIKEVEYNGVWMAEGWPDQIVAAQEIKKISIVGKRRNRVRYGSEKDWDHDFSLPCGDCAVLKGQFHVPQCDVEQCPSCLAQLASCGCIVEE